MRLKKKKITDDSDSHAEVCTGDMIDWSIFDDDVSSEQEVFLDRPVKDDKSDMLSEKEKRVYESKGGAERMERRESRKSKDESERDGVTTRGMRKFMQGWMGNSQRDNPASSVSADPPEHEDEQCDLHVQGAGVD